MDREFWQGWMMAGSGCSKKTNGEADETEGNDSHNHPHGQNLPQKQSLLTRYPYGDPPKDQVCHLWLKDGVLNFLNDCTHHLKGQKVLLQDIPPDAL